MHAPTQFPVLVNPDARTDGWTYVATGTIGNMPAVTLDSNLILASKRLKFEVELGLAAGDSAQLYINGANTNLKCCEARWHAGGVTPASAERTGWRIANGEDAATTNKMRIWGEITLATGEYRYMKCEFVTYATVADRPECHGIIHGTYKDTATAISSIQVCAVNLNPNHLTGSKARFSYSD